MNRNYWITEIVLAGLVFASFAIAAEGNGSVEFYVAPNGSDGNPGTKDKPFATLEKARDAVRQRKNGGGAVVYLRGGIHRQAQTLEFTEADSGAKGAPVVYRAAEGEEARIVGGRMLTAGDFKPVTEPEILSRLDPSARGKVVCLDLAAIKIDHAGPFPHVFNDGGKICELFFNGKRMPLSRWPNEGYVTMAKVLDPGDSNKGPSRHGGVFVYHEDRPSRWNVADDVWLKGFWRVPWEIQAIKVKSIDSARKEIAFLEPIPAGIGSKYVKSGGSGKEPWCAINLLEEIDSPGEWCIHFKSRKLYFWPPAPLEGASVMISDLEKPIVSAKNASNLVFRGLTLEGGLGNAIEFTGGSGNLVAGCTIRNMGKSGVILKDGTNSGVAGCNIYDMGWGGVYISGGDRKTLTPCNHYVVNNDIHDFGQIRKTYAPAVQVGAYEGSAVGCRVANNAIHDAPHAGILYGGNDNTLEYNEIYRIALDSGDVGAMYTWNDWTSRGNVVQYNFVHDSPNANGVYMDDGDSGDTVAHNIFYKMQCGPFIGGGHDNIVRNNLCVECDKAIHFDSRGVARQYATSKKLIGMVKEVNPKQPPWSTRYPEMADLLESQPDMPRGDVIETNVAVNCPRLVNQSGPKEHFTRSKVQNNISLTLEDAGFVNIARGDFHLRADSAVFQKLPGFKPIPFEKIGLYLDEYRTKLPARTSAGMVGPREKFNSETDMQQSNKKK